MVKNFIYIILLAFSFKTAISQKAELIVQLGHSDAVRCISYNATETYIVSGSNDHTVKLWQTQSGLLVRTFYGLRRPVCGVAFHPSGNAILALDEEGNLITWNLNGSILSKVVLPKRKAAQMVSSFDRSKILIASDSSVLIYDVNKSAVSEPLPIFKNSISYVAFANGTNNKFAVLESDLSKGSITIYNDGQTKTYNVAEGFLNAVEFLPSNKQLAFTGGGYQFGKYGVLDLETGKTVWSVSDKTTGFESIGIIDDKRLMISSKLLGNILVVDATTGQVLADKKEHTGFVNSIQNLKKSNSIVTAASDRMIKMWDATSIEPIKTFASISDYVWSISLGSDGKTLAAAGGTMDKEQSIKMWDISHGKFLRRINDIPDRMIACAISPNMKWLASGTFEGKSAWWELPNANTSGTMFGPTGKIKSVSFHARSNYYIAAGDNGNILLTRVKLNKTETIKSNADGVSSVAFSNDGEYFLAGTDAGTTEFWDFDKREKVIEWPTHKDVGSFFDTSSYIPYNTNFRMNITGFGEGNNSASVNTVAFNKDDKLIAAGGAASVVLIDVPTKKLLAKFGNLGGVVHLAFGKKSNLIAIACADHSIKIADASTGKILYNLQGHDNEVRSVQFTNDDKFLVSGSLDTQIKIWDLTTGKEVLSMLSLTNSNEYIIYNSNGYYLSSKGAGRALAFRIDNEVYPFAQFDIKYNRPDIIIEDLNKIFYNADKNSPLKSLQSAYNSAYKKRLKKLNFNEEDLGGDIHVPKLTVKNADTKNGVLQLSVLATDEKYNLDRLQVYVNEVPFYGTKGVSVKQENSKQIARQIEIPLTTGDNNIQVSCINEKGAESFKATVKANNPLKEKSNTHVICISVSRYKDSTMNLNYAVKDGSDIISHFKLNSTGNVFVDSFFDERATLENIRTIKQKLENTKANDQVVLFVSGHGMLDKDFNFYFATHDIDFDNPSARGLAYDELESLLDGIPARKKLMLMDACHSGEVDIHNEDSAINAASPTSNENVKTYTYRSNIKNQKPKENLGLNNSFELMQQLFTNLSQGSGALVISAAAGVGFALESPEWNNGLFTYTVLNALKNKRGDENKNGNISVNELKNFVTKEVERLSNGKQKPTTRKELLEWDWEL